MIVCSCNVLTDRQILGTLQGPNAGRPCSPAQAYRGLGCSPRCGRCAPTIRAMLAAAHIASCEGSCRHCPAKDATPEPANKKQPQAFLLAAE